MSTLDATVSMLEAMPEDARIKVMEFTQKLFTPRKPANPFVPVSQEQILSDLAKSRQQISDGKGLELPPAPGRLISFRQFLIHPLSPLPTSSSPFQAA